MQKAWVDFLIRQAVNMTVNKTDIKRVRYCFTYVRVTIVKSLNALCISKRK